MEFCPKCGAVLVEKSKNYGCPRCSYSAKGKVKIESNEQVKSKKEEINILKEKETDVMPKITATCPKCKNGEAYFWSSQTRAADEAETRFFKCTKCKHTWREYR
ncbi:transcription factor S [Candidatus Pacearchaeota archaeon]|nr:transcription factor S [Candidatus Pacearchaeota archaeon]